MLEMAATPRPSCVDLDVGKLRGQDTDGRSRALSRCHPPREKPQELLKDREARCAPPRVLADFWTSFSGEAGTF
jgi:hypothetical protein